MRHFQYLVAVARHRHFGRAADDCCVTQSTLSLGIKELERRLGFALVLRGRRYLGLTSEGEIAVSYAKKLLMVHKDLRRALEQYTCEFDKPIIAGAVPSGLGVVARLATELCKKGVTRSFSILTATRDTIVEGVREGDMDIGVTYVDALRSNVDVIADLSEEATYIVGPRRRGLDVEVVALADLLDVPLCHLSPGNYGADVAKHFLGTQAASQPRMCVDSLPAMRAHLDQGYWHALVPSGALDAINDVESMTIRPLQAGTRCPRLVLISRPIGEYSDRGRAIVEHIKGLAINLAWHCGTAKSNGRMSIAPAYEDAVATA